MKQFVQRLSIALAGLSLAGCAATVQTSSGEQYLERESYPRAFGEKSLSTDDAEFVAAASVEPLLRFPAKIGLARIEGGRLTPIPDAEMAAWAELAEEANGAYGTFAPLNLLVTEMATPHRRETRWYADATQVVRKIRLGAARQHMDAIFVYEVFGTSKDRQNALSVGDLTLLGAFILPGRSVSAVGHAEGILVDVRNGYPYITASETVDREGTAAAARVLGRSAEMKDKAMLQAVLDMTETLGPAMGELAVELGKLDQAKLAQR